MSLFFRYSSIYIVLADIKNDAMLTIQSPLDQNDDSTHNIIHALPSTIIFCIVLLYIIYYNYRYIPIIYNNCVPILYLHYIYILNTINYTKSCIVHKNLILIFKKNVK